MTKPVLILAAIVSAVVATPAFAAEDVPATLTALEHKWVDAIITRDATALGAILATDWHGQSPSGKRNDRAASIASLKDKADILTKSTLRDMHVTVLSPTIAIVQGAEDDIGSYHGKSQNGPASWTDVFQKRGGKWVAVASQFTKIEKP